MSSVSEVIDRFAAWAFENWKIFAVLSALAILYFLAAAGRR